MRCLEKGTALSEEFTPRDEWQWLVPNNMWSVIFFIMSEKKSYHLATRIQKYTKEGCLSETDSTRVWYKASLAKPTATCKLITKAQSIPTKNPKATKYCAQQQKWCMNHGRIWKKVFKQLWEQAKYEGTGNANESSKATKYCTQQQKCCMNYCPIGKKQSK